MAPTNFDPARTTEFTVDEAVDAVSADPSIAQAVIDAENARTDREPRSTLIERVSALKPADGDPTPPAQNEPQAQNPAATAADQQIPPLDVEQQQPGDGIVKTGIEVAPGETATLTGDGTPGQQLPSRWAGLYARATALDPVRRSDFDERMRTAGVDWSDLVTNDEKQDTFERFLVDAENAEPGAVPSSTRVENLTYADVMAGDPMSDENRGSAPVGDPNLRPDGE